MKHLPNLLTLGNLFCGCIAIAYILSAQPYLGTNIGDGGMPAWFWVYGSEQMYLGSLFILIAAVCDLLDGFAARALRVFSPIGKDLDSLADMVSFGVAPSVILFKLLWNAAMGETNAFQVNMLALVPAFLVACFAALRLAKFNITAAQQKGFFIGTPTPAVGLFVASLPLVLWLAPANYAHFINACLESKWTLYLIIVVLCWLMVSKVKFIKLMPAKWNIAHTWPQIVLILATAAAVPFMKIVAAPFAFVLYVLLSIIYKQPESQEAVPAVTQ